MGNAVGDDAQHTIQIIHVNTPLLDAGITIEDCFKLFLASLGADIGPEQKYMVKILHGSIL